MPTNPSHPQTTRLENLTFESDGARFDLDGRTVLIGKSTDASGVAALQAFHRSALADYHARISAGQKPGWFARLRSWLSRVIGGSEPPHSTPAPLRPAFIPPEDGQRRDKPVAAADRRESAVPAPRRNEAKLPGHAVRPGPDSPAEPDSSGERALQPSASHASEPLLRAVFADPGGVHLIWQTPGAREPRREVECLCALDSDLAGRLQDCYGHLRTLGYKVVGLDLMKIGSREPEEAAAAAPSPVALCAAAEAPAPPLLNPNEELQRPADKKERLLVMRLLPEPADQPNRALVSPVESAENTQVLVAPERLLRSLRNAADPGRPAAERLTYLRCAQGKNGLKVVDVGLGEGKEHAPARWEELARWLPQQQAEAGAASKKAPPAPEAPPGIRSGPELELNL